MNTLFLVASGGALGALARYGLSAYAQTRITHEVLGVASSTLLVNLLGSLLLGVSYVVIVEKMQLPPEWRQFLMIGFLSAFTTFSTFALDSVQLLEAGHIGEAFGYIIASALLCVLGCGLAISLTRLI